MKKKLMIATEIKEYMKKTVQETGVCSTGIMICDAMVVNQTYNEDFGIGYEIVAPPFVGKIIFEITFNNGDKDGLRKEAKQQIGAMYAYAQEYPFDSFNIHQKYKDEAANTDQDGEYCYIPASTCYQVNHAIVANGIVTKSWFTFLYADFDGDDSLNMDGFTADELIDLGYELTPNNTLTIFINNSKGWGSDYHGLQTPRHGNRNTPTQTFKTSATITSSPASADYYTSKMVATHYATGGNGSVYIIEFEDSKTIVIDAVAHDILGDNAPFLEYYERIRECEDFLVAPQMSDKDIELSFNMTVEEILKYVGA